MDGLGSRLCSTSNDLFVHLVFFFSFFDELCSQEDKELGKEVQTIFGHTSDQHAKLARESGNANFLSNLIKLVKRFVWKSRKNGIQEIHNYNGRVYKKKDGQQDQLQARNEPTEVQDTRSPIPEWNVFPLFQQTFKQYHDLPRATALVRILFANIRGAKTLI